MAARFNPPPGWPPSPEGWTPPPGWQPDPSWPAPPAGWQLWIEEGAPGAPVPSDLGRFAGSGAADATQAMPAQVPAPAPTPGTLPPAGAWAPQGEASAWQQGGANAAWTPTGAPTPGRKAWLIPVIAAVVAILLIVGVLFATGVIGGSDDPKDDKTTAEKKTKDTKDTKDKESEEPSDEPTDEETDKPTEKATEKPTDKPTSDSSGSAETGTRDAPLAPNTVLEAGDWTIEVGSSDTDAWPTYSKTLSESDKMWDEPEDGYVWVMAPGKLTYTGPDSAVVFMAVDWTFVAKSGNIYTDSCGLFLDTVIDPFDELYTDASLTGNFCYSVPEEDAEGGVWKFTVTAADYSSQVDAFFAAK